MRIRRAASSTVSRTRYSSVSGGKSDDMNDLITPMSFDPQPLVLQGVSGLTGQEGTKGHQRSPTVTNGHSTVDHVSHR